MRICLGHIVFALIIASILNLVIAWLCAYYAVPVYNGAILLTAEEFDRDTGLLTERDQDLAIAPWTALGLMELDCVGPWFIWEPPEILERQYPPQEYADQIDIIMEENAPSHDPLEQNGLRRQLFEISFRRHTCIDAGWPMRSFRGFISGGLQGPFKPATPSHLYKQLPQEESTVIAVVLLISIKSSLCRYLPYMPIWFGLIVNTVLYATIVISIMWLLITIRSKLRLRRNLCPNCKYPIGVSEVCTECGHLLPKKKDGATGSGFA